MKNIIIVIVAIVGVVFPSLFIIANAVDRTDKTVACMQKEIETQREIIKKITENAKIEQEIREIEAHKGE
jgi:uncharacterized protein YxeA